MMHHRFEHQAKGKKEIKKWNRKGCVSHRNKTKTQPKNITQPLTMQSLEGNQHPSP